MPNWIEGTLKLRGDREHIKKFFLEGLELSSWFGEESRIEDQVIDQSDNEYDYLCFEFVGEPYIAGTRRAFITGDYAEMSGAYGTCCVNVKQAWRFSQDVNIWEEIAKTYDVDLKLYGIECGTEVVEEVIIIRGHRPIVNHIGYGDWMWECPFPCMGG